MGHWNYRVMKKLNSSGEHEYGIHEVYYDEDGNIKGWTQSSVTPTFPSEEDLLQGLERMKAAVEKETLVDKDGKKVEDSAA